MRRLVIASHERMAEGVKNTLDFITNNSFSVYAVNAYTTQVPLEEQLQSVFDIFGSDDEVVILTDMLTGSVNQACIPYRNDHVFLITGFNIPAALEILLYPQNKKLNEKELSHIVEAARRQLQLVICTEELEDE
ncbi:PTS fructose transporter subunit IIA [[Clostridium] innocuum]|nr:PTS fructose transporter subunit IIA [Erysipelotrichaceae bacterium]MCR0383967.1 PTS fructose transporter subunit IIA [[Clostridium] innocuum]MCR0414718.1 PTS fructose transporter subunit IIA [[Clostridium] innocuum]MCR0535654.1 PTS fructose transporter subunit IIA [[Clostridium] innocuum]MCR0540426.1 PTS fructose transporter subunit IIA [[Clostridium] innocuum]